MHPIPQEAHTLEALTTLHMLQIGKNMFRSSSYILYLTRVHMYQVLKFIVLWRQCMLYGSFVNIDK